MSTCVPSDTFQPVQPMQHCIPMYCGLWSPLVSHLWSHEDQPLPHILPSPPAELSGLYFGLHYCPIDHPAMVPEGFKHFLIHHCFFWNLNRAHFDTSKTHSGKYFYGAFGVASIFKMGFHLMGTHFDRCKRCLEPYSRQEKKLQPCYFSALETIL